MGEALRNITKNNKSTAEGVGDAVVGNARKLGLMQRAVSENMTALMWSSFLIIVWPFT